MLKTEIPFARDDANRFLPWMIALMCGITALMLCVGITLGEWVKSQPGKMEGRFTVQVPYQGDGQAAMLKKVLAEIKETPGLIDVKALRDEDVRKLVEPWLGENEAIRNLPMPSVIEGRADAATDFNALAHKLQRIAPEISVDTQALWAEKFSRLSTALQASMFALAAIIIGALAGMMVFTARAAMKLHADAVQLLHSVGADDKYIAKQFQANALTLALSGAVPGTLGAALLYALFAFYTNRLDAPIMPNVMLGAPHVLMFLLLPAVCCAVGVLSVRISATAQLKLLP
jgi:cell division transport system permease protein